MRDFLETDMPGWKTLDMGQRQDATEFKSRLKIQEGIDELKALLRPEYSLLDVGCYKGFLYDVIGHEDYLGVDLFPEHIEKARSLHPGVRFEVVDLFDLTGSWDVVWCSRVLMHVPNIRGALDVLYRSARRYLILILEIGQESLVREKSGVYYRKIPREALEDGYRAKAIRGSPYSVVVYEKD